MAEIPTSLVGSILTAEEVRQYISDSDIDNHLLDGVEFTDERIWMAMRMAISEFNMTPPLTSVTAADFPGGEAPYLYGILTHLFKGQSAMTARNQMSYSDGGLNIPVEERYQYYMSLAETYERQWKTAIEQIKIYHNIAGGWDMVHSDYANFPNW